MTLLGYTFTPEFWALLGVIVTGVGRWAWEWNKGRNIRLGLEAERIQRLKEREEDRKDLLAAAKAAALLNKQQLVPVLNQLEALDKAGTNRLKALMQSNVTTRTFNKKAIDAANNVNEKLKMLGEKIVEAKEIPQQVEVVNKPDHPIPTTIEMHPDDRIDPSI